MSDDLATRCAAAALAVLEVHRSGGMDSIEVEDDDEGDDFWACCSCGWRGPHRKAALGIPEALRGDHDAHVAEILGRGMAAALATARRSGERRWTPGRSYDAALAAFTKATAPAGA